MSYYNLETSFKPIEERFENLASNSNKSVASQFKKNIGNAGLAITIFITRAADSLIGTLSGLGSLAILHSNKSLRKFTKRHLESSDEILLIPYGKLMKIVSDVDLSTGNPKGSKVLPYMHKLITTSILPLKKSNKWILSGVVFRIAALIALIFTNVAACIDITTGVIAAGLSLLTLGKVKSLNHFAATQLGATSTLEFNYVLTKMATSHKVAVIAVFS